MVTTQLSMPIMYRICYDIGLNFSSGIVERIYIDRRIQNNRRLGKFHEKRYKINH